jgi:hypothetical protein
MLEKPGSDSNGGNTQKEFNLAQWLCVWFENLPQFNFTDRA